MDPITLILTALAAGATASIQTTAGEAVKDAYTGLKTLIQRKFVGKPSAEVALAEHEKKPDIWKAPLAQGLKETEADQDQDIIAAAQQLIQLAQIQLGDKKNTNVTFQGPAQGTNIGDDNTITQTFGEISSEK
jgi:hypothetical protein